MYPLRTCRRKLVLLSAWFCSISSSLYAFPLETQYHADTSKRPKQIFYPRSESQPRARNLLTIAKNYIRSQAQTFGLRSGEPLPQLIETRESLVGTHFRFQQRVGQIPIDRAEIIVSVLPSGRIFQVYNMLTDLPVPPLSLRSAPRLSLDEAYDQAWQWLGVRGQLFQDPQGALRYSVEAGSLRPIYRLQLSTTLPYGLWTIDVDAVTGSVLRADDARLEHKTSLSLPLSLSLPSTGLSNDRKAAFADWERQKQSKRSFFSLRSLSSGSAQVFNPDPRTTLNTKALDDNSPASAFLPAYKEEVLPEVSFDGQSYYLQGPWAQIIDFDPPTKPPTPSSDGSWKYQRGASAFNEAMSYFHIDQNQRYLQKLGYKDARGIQNRPIEIDADGVNGEDSSYYDRTSRRLSFGHGCVDDNEDADVILHEYAHAIHMDINPSWEGGDMGAIGEGFGDYWAASYSLSTPEGANFFPEEVFNWDGRGSCNSSWVGRRLDAIPARYDVSRDYEAHTYVEGGFQSDELWSTPLFQSLLSLKALGIPREEVDTIILEAQFGLGSGLKMRELAQSIVAVSEALYPEGPHAGVFTRNFVRQGILDLPRPELEITLISSLDSGGDGSIDPGEERTVRVRVLNKGDRSATDVKLALNSSDPALLPLLGLAEIENLGPGQSEDVELIYKVAPEAICGTELKASIDLSYEDFPALKLSVDSRLGSPSIFRKEAQPFADIPDGSPLGLTSVIKVETRAQVSPELRIELLIRHSYRGDLKVTLKSPSGKEIILHHNSGYSLDDIEGVYPLSLEPKDSLGNLLGEPMFGDWTLWVQDNSESDTGKLMSWAISDTNSYSCQ